MHGPGPNIVIFCPRRWSSQIFPTPCGTNDYAWIPKLTELALITWFPTTIAAYTEFLDPNVIELIHRATSIKQDRERSSDKGCGPHKTIIEKSSTLLTTITTSEAQFNTGSRTYMETPLTVSLLNRAWNHFLLTLSREHTHKHTYIHTYNGEITHEEYYIQAFGKSTRQDDNTQDKATELPAKIQSR